MFELFKKKSKIKNQKSFLSLSLNIKTHQKLLQHKHN